ncbi:MAG: response regulator [Gemmatimonadota bacterium]|nr:response regulator [Gemmatimonadota bacterium]
MVLGFAEFVMRHPALPHESRRDLGEIQKAAERAASVTRQVLAFSRQQVLLPETLDINAVVTEAHAMLSRLLGEDIDLVLDLTPRVGQVRADRNQIIQALVNLSINARDAMPGGGEVTISTAPTVVGATDLRRHIGADAVPGEYVSITVTDTGTGMDASVLARAFEPFFTTKPVGNGTGLGLSTVYGIVKQSGGYVWAQSEPGAGTTFNVLLPRSTSAVTAVPAARAPAAGIEGNGTILVVEDEPLVRAMARRTLEELGYDVVDAPGGAAALELAMDLGDELRLVITDVVMPGMNGRDFAARLLERRPDLPVLFVSGHPSQFVVEQGLLERGQAFLQKPFLPDVLGAAVRSLLEAVYR